MSMLRKISASIITAVFLVPLVFSTPVVAVEAKCTVSVVATAQINQDSTSTAEIQISSDVPIIGFELYVKCDTNVLIFEDAAEGNISQLELMTEKKDDGLVYIAGYITSLNPIASGILARVQFKAVGAVDASTEISVSGDVYSWEVDNSSGSQVYNPILIPAEFSSARVQIAIIHTVTMATNPAGSGTTTPGSGTHEYVDNSVVEISALPASGYEFTRWDGDVADPESAVTTTTIKSSKTLVANFRLIGSDTPVIVDTTPPVLKDIRAVNIGKYEAEIIWSTDEIADSQVEYWVSTSQMTKLDPNPVIVHAAKLTGLEPLTTYNYKVLSRDLAGFISTSDVQSFTTQGIPAAFVTDKLTVQVEKTSEFQKLVINYTVTNAGDIPGIYEVDMKVNGNIIRNTSLELAAEESQQVHFEYEPSESGRYTVKVGDYTVLFAVEAPTPDLWPWLVGLCMAFIIIILIMAFLMMRKRHIDKEFGQLPLSTEKTGQHGKDEFSTAFKSAIPSGEALAPGIDNTDKAVLSDIPVKLGGFTLNITANAFEKLKAYSGRVSNPLQALRIINSPVNPRMVTMGIDNFKEGDYTVDASGRNILFVSPDAAALLNGATLDYQENPSGGEYFISRKFNSR